MNLANLQRLHLHPQISHRKPQVQDRCRNRPRRLSRTSSPSHHPFPLRMEDVRRIRRGLDRDRDRDVGRDHDRRLQLRNLRQRKRRRRPVCDHYLEGGLDLEQDRRRSHRPHILRNLLLVLIPDLQVRRLW